MYDVRLYIYTGLAACVYVCTYQPYVMLCDAMWCSASEQWLALVLQLKPAPTLTNYPHTPTPGRAHAPTHARTPSADRPLLKPLLTVLA